MKESRPPGMKTQRCSTRRSRWLILSILLIPYFEPSYAATIQSVHALYKYARILVGLLVVISYLFYKRKSLFIAVVLLYNFALLLSTVIGRGDYSEWFSSACYIVTICMIAEMAATRSVVLFLQALYYLLGVLIYVNAILVFLYPNGLFYTEMFGQTAYFLADKNALGAILIPQTAVAALYSTLRFQKITAGAKLMILACCVSQVIVWSGTSLVGMALGMIYLCFVYRKNLSGCLNFKTYLIVYAVLFVLIVVLRFQNWFSFIIEELLGKDVTLTGRTFIWDNALHMIKNSVFIGYGFRRYGLYVPYIGLRWEAHNQFIQNMLMGGLVGTALFVAVMLLCGARLIKYRNTDASSLLSAYLFIFLVMMMTDYYYNSLMFFILLTVGYHMPAIAQQTGIPAINHASLTDAPRQKASGQIVVGRSLYNGKGLTVKR